MYEFGTNSDVTNFVFAVSVNKQLRRYEFRSDARCSGAYAK